MPVAGAVAPTRRTLAELLAEARTRTLLLVAPLSQEEMAQEPEPGVESVLSQLAQILRHEESLLPSDHQPWPIATYDEWFDTMSDVRELVLQQLEQADLDRPDLAQRYRDVIQHEYERGEALLEALDARGEPYRPVQVRRLPRGRRLADPGMMVRFPGGHHRPFWIDITPVTNGDFLTFMGEGGYSTRELWSEDGWQWLRDSHIHMPRNWSWQDGAWWLRCMGRDRPLDFNCPVTHVSCHEAEAFARFVGKRLPTDQEWEAAAGWDPETQWRREFPWGNMQPSPHVANLDQLGFGAAAVGAYPGNLSPIGCYGMIGDVWEWTESAEPGSQAVLRGGSWATRSGAIRISTRRSASPAVRHFFTGFRCARDG